MSNNFYVYSLHINDKEIPFYIGKGKKDRKDMHVYESLRKKDVIGNNRTIKENKILKAISNGDIIISKIVKDNLFESVAFELEEFLILSIGRIDLKTGPLTNMSNGGEGNAGCKWSDESKSSIKGRVPWNKGIPHSQKSKDKMSKAHKGSLKPWKIGKMPDNVKEALIKSRKGFVVSQETKDKMSKAHKGKPKPWMVGNKASQETKDKMSDKRKGKKRYANFKTLKIIYILPEDLSLFDDIDDWHQWVPSWGFRDKELRKEYPKSLFYPKLDQ